MRPDDDFSTDQVAEALQMLTTARHDRHAEFREYSENPEVSDTDEEMDSDSSVLYSFHEAGGSQ